jgi:hypothetical protein
MSCIACGSGSEFRCTIKGMTVCLCREHIGVREEYDSIAPEAS